MKKNLIKTLSQLLLVAAPMLVGIASVWYWGEPDIPDCLK